MLELTLPVTATYPKDAEPVYTYRTFTEKDLDVIVEPIKKAILESQAKEQAS